MNSGRFVDLDTGRTLSLVVMTLYLESYLSKIRNGVSDYWHKRQEQHREHAEFYGFRQGLRQNGADIDWAEGEGPVTTTVYNIEVADTHTYFIGEQGVWVHNSDNCFTGESVRDSVPVIPGMVQVKCTMKVPIQAGTCCG